MIISNGYLTLDQNPPFFGPECKSYRAGNRLLMLVWSLKVQSAAGSPIHPPKSFSSCPKWCNRLIFWIFCKQNGNCQSFVCNKDSQVILKKRLKIDLNETTFQPFVFYLMILYESQWVNHGEWYHSIIISQVRFAWQELADRQPVGNRFVRWDSSAPMKRIGRQTGGDWFTNWDYSVHT